MLFLRSFARAVPRSFATLSGQTIRRALANPPRSPILQQSWKLAATPRYSPFSTSRIAWEKEGLVDEELVAKLDSEIAVEKEARDSEQLPPSIQDFLDTSSFKLEDVPGVEEAVLTRQFGDETIRLSFSIADLNALDQDPDQYSEDKAQYDEQEEDLLPETQTGGAQSKGVINQGKTKGGNFAVQPEDQVGAVDEAAQDDESGNEDGNEDPSFPARVYVTIQKPGTGAMQIETVVQDGEIVIEHVNYFSKGELADPKSIDQDWSKRQLYTGPPFGNLDEELQVLLERYLEERGVNTALALWIPEYIDFKEQKEYLNWLSNVKTFVDA